MLFTLTTWQLFLTDSISLKSRQLVKKITRLWSKTTVKAVFNAVYGAHPPLEYVPAPPPLTIPASTLPTRISLARAAAEPTSSAATSGESPTTGTSTTEPAVPTPAITPQVPAVARSSSRVTRVSTIARAGSGVRPSTTTTRAGPSGPVAELSPVQAEKSPRTRIYRDRRPRQHQEPLEGNPNLAVRSGGGQPSGGPTVLHSRKRTRAQEKAAPERQVQEPPTGGPDFHGRSAAKRQNVGRYGTSGSNLTSSNPASQSALDQIELELIKYPDGVRGVAEMDNFTMNITLYDQFNNPKQMLRAVELLSRISSGNLVSTTVDVSTIPSTMALTESNRDVLQSLLAASREANDYLRNLKRNVQATRMKAIMSYIILHLTLEHAVVPRIQRDEPDKTAREVQGIKYLRFAEILKESYPESTIDGTKIRTDSQYGKSFWDYGQALGIASLLLFAVSDIGLTKIGKASRSGIPAIAASLTTSGTWWAFAHAIGPAAFRTLFGPRDIAYTIPQLLARIQCEPLALPIGEIGDSSGESRLTPTEFPAVENWKIVIGTDTLEVHRHPRGALKPEQIQKRNLGMWLNNTSGDDIVVDADGNKTPFAPFKTLLPPNNISEQLVNYLTKLYNSKAIPGRIALPYGALAEFFAGGSFQKFLESLERAAKYGKKLERIVCPFDLETATIGIIIYPITSQAVAYDWTSDARLGEGILKVCNLLSQARFEKLGSPLHRNSESRLRMYIGCQALHQSFRQKS